jgi:hypothetical protein
MHGHVPISGAAHRGEDEEEATFGDGPADGVAPVGDEEAIFDQFSGDELFYATGEISDIAKLAGFADRKVVGKGRATPGAEKGFGLMFFEKRLPGCWIGEWEGDRNLAEREGVQLGLDSGRQEVFALFRGQGNQENGRRH